MNENKRRGGRVSAHAATDGHGHGNAAGSIRGMSRDLCTEPSTSRSIQQPRRVLRTGGATVTGGESGYAPICNHP